MAYYQKLKRSMRGCRPKLSIGLLGFEEGFTLDLFGLFFPLPFLNRFHQEPEELMDRWGFTYFERALQFCWRNKCKIVRMPWDFERIRHEVMTPSGQWVPFVGCWEDKEPDGRWEATYRYVYVLKNGTVQNREATIVVERREWRWLWFQWLPWPSKKRQSINVIFNDEVGERTGSWKGGCIGTGYDMLPGETPEQTLRRMERDRKFD